MPVLRRCPNSRRGLRPYVLPRRRQTLELWNFSTGPIAATALAQTGDLGGRQTYIPSTGLLVRMKMYWPLQPGTSNLDPELIRATVRANAIAKGVLQAEPDAVRRKPKATSRNCFGMFAVDRPAS